MDNFLEYLENNLSQKGYLKVKSVDFLVSEEKILFNILYDDNFTDVFLREKSLIEKLTAKYVDNTKFEIVFKKSYLDESSLKYMLLREIKNSKNNLLSDLTILNIEVVKFFNKFKIKIFLNLYEDMQNLYQPIFAKFFDELKEDYFYDFEFSFEFLVKERIDYIKVYEDTKEEIIEEEIEEFITISMDDRIILYGQKIEEKPINLELIKNPLDHICTCGKISNIKKNEYLKPKKNETDPDKVSHSYSFLIEYGNTKMKCRYYLKKDEIEKVQMINNNDEVIIEGKIGLYNEELSLTAKNITKCILPEYKEKEIIMLPTPEDYKTIFPEPFEKLIQFDMFKLMSDKPVCEHINNNVFVVFDIETTGLDVEKDMITEISAIKIKNGRMIEQFNALINPEREIPVFIQELTHITDDMVKDCPTIDKVIRDFKKFTDGAILVAYNAPFDVSFIKKQGKRNCYEFNNEVEDALVLARNKIKGLKSYKLKNVAKFLNVALIGAHRAINDTLATAEVFLKLYDVS